MYTSVWDTHIYTILSFFFFILHAPLLLMFNFVAAAVPLLHSWSHHRYNALREKLLFRYISFSTHQL